METRKTKCPLCGEESMTVTLAEEDIPFFGGILIMGMNCGNCGFRTTDVQCTEDKGHVKYRFVAEGAGDMSVKVMRSSKGKLSIPELGVEITPGPASEGFVTNVEGLLEKVRGGIETAAKWGDEAQKKNAEKLLSKIDSMISGKMKMTIILDDPTGNSAIVSAKTKKVRLKD